MDYEIARASDTVALGRDELIVGGTLELLRGIEDPLRGPFVVLEQLIEVDDAHGILLGRVRTIVQGDRDSNGSGRCH